MCLAVIKQRQLITDVEGPTMIDNPVITAHWKETDSLEKYYSDPGNEDIRLTKSRAQRLQYLTTMHYLKRICGEGSIVLDACAGTGAYCFDLAKLGAEVTAGDIVPGHIQIIRKKEQELHLLEDVYVGDCLDLTRFENDSFDVVLCMGAYYHLQEADDREKALLECKRVAKKDGLVLVAYLNRFACFYQNFVHHPDRLSSILEEFETGKRRVFYRSPPDEIDELMSKLGIEKLHNIGISGLVRIWEDQLESLSEELWDAYVAHHLTTCEEPSTLGLSVHGLFIGRK